ncbi:MAG: polyphosphate polymerase domain-containing protein [Clostridia bacterium]|nr:polyphosphate polymerase domain-containing protein [Clostridia bacterium]
MAFGVTFKRYEKKFLLNPEQYEAVRKEINKHFIPDKYGETTICNIYYDTPDYLLIQRSIDKPVFKEKVRLRTYGVPTDNTVSFLEVKRKFNKVVYKRRIHLPYTEAIDYVASIGENNGKSNDTSKDPDKTQILKEIEYLLSLYKGLCPKFYISYDRCAFFYKETNDIRITFDKNLTWRDYDLDLRLGSYGEQLLPDGYTIMEIKVPNTVPLWLATLLSEQKIYSSSFSKVGTAYKTMLARKLNRPVAITGNPRLIMQANKTEN